MIAVILTATQATAAQVIIKTSAEYFSPGDVKIYDPEFKNLQTKGKDYLLWLNPDALLHFYRTEAGLAPKAAPYLGWESEDVWGAGPLRGGFLGYYTSALSMMWQATGDPALMERLCYVLSELDECRRAGKDGYIMGIKDGRKIFEQAASGDIRSNNPTLNGAWAPVYLINKLMLGLGEAYRGCGRAEALPLLTGLADWFGTQVVDKLSDEQVQKMLVCEHGSINESYALVYELTGDARYLAWAGRLNDAAMWKPLSDGKDILNGWHANTQIPKFTGFFKYYTHTGDERFAIAARNFWDIVARDHTWAIGGNSTGEHFFPKEEFSKRVLLKGGPETCNSANMLRLTEALFADKPDARMADYYERVLLNHIMSAHEPETGMPCYFTSMRPGHYRVYGSRDKSFWCCQQTGMESPAKLGKFIYAKKGGDLMINLFVSSSLTWKEQGVTLTQQSALADGRDKIVFRIQRARDARAPMRMLVRKPHWAGRAAFWINGERCEPSLGADGYWVLEKNWTGDDVVTMELPMRIRVETLPGSDEFVSLSYGPYVLAGELGNANPPASYWATMHNTAENVIAWENVPAFAMPVSEIPKCVSKTNDARDGHLSFCINAKGFPEDLRLEPFYRLHFQRYAVYWKRNNR